jgi:hypothetical protein
MPSNVSMDKVVKKLSSAEKPNSDQQKLIAVDLKTKEIKRILPGGLVIGGKAAFYLVSNNLDHSNLADYEDLEAEVKDFSGNRTIGLRIAYQASCDSGNEENLAIALCSEYPPEYELHRKIKGWISAFTKGEAGTRFVDHFLTEIPKLEIYLKEEALGISLNLEQIRITTDRNPTYYLITNAKDSANIAERENFNVLLRDVTNTREIGVLLSYQASFFSENLSKVIDALCNDQSIVETIDSKLKEWTLRFVDSKGTASFIENYAVELSRLQQALEQKAREEAGLRLSVRATLDRNPVRYLISTISDPSNIADRTNLKVLVADVRGNRRVHLSINYRAGYDPRDEAIVASAFESSKSIRDEIDRRIEGWINTYLGNDEAGFIDRYSKAETETLTHRIQEEARKIGLKLDLRVSLDRETELKPFDFGSEKSPIEIPIYTGGCEDELSLRLWLKLAVNESKRINAVLRSLPAEEMKIFSAVKMKITTFFREEVSIKDFCYELKGKVRDRLLETLNQFLEEYGRKAEDFFLDSDTYFPNGKTIAVGSSQAPVVLQVHLRDCDDEIELSLHTALILDEDNLAKGAFYSLPSKENFLRIEFEKFVKEFLNTEISIKEFSSNLKGKVRDDLVNYLNESFSKKYGYKIQFLDLVSNLALPPDIIEVFCSLQCMVDGYPEPVEIRNTVQMLPSDYAKYRQMIPQGVSREDIQHSPLKTWVESRLEKVVKPLLLQKRYIDLLTEKKLQEIADSIKEKMKQEARSIGFSIEHIVSVPNIPHLDLREDSQLEQKGSYLTNDANVEVKLNTLVSLKFERFDKLESYLKLTIDAVRQKIRETIDQTVSKCLAKVDPERYYMRFYHADSLDAQSVEVLLEAEIRQKLEEQYGATVLTVTPRPINTDIADLFRQLRGEVPSFEFVINSLTGGEAITFRAQFQVEGVGKDSWVTFDSRMGAMLRAQEPQRQELKRLKDLYDKQVKSSDLEDSKELKALRNQMNIIQREISGIEVIKESIVSSIEQILSAYDSAASTYIDPANLAALQKSINQWASESVREQYGLEISIRNLRRDRTEGERKLFEVQNTLRIEATKDAETALKIAENQREAQFKLMQGKSQSKLEELEKLRSKRSKLDPNEEADEIKQMDNRINDLEAEINAPSISNTEAALKALEAKSTPKAKSFLEAQAQLNPAEDSQSETASADEKLVDPEA